MKSIVTGHDIDSLHDSFGKSSYGKKSVRTARKWGAGICNIGGHCGGLGMGQLTACIKVEYSNPQTFSHTPSPFVSTQTQPQLFFGLSNSLLTIFWSRTSNKQRMNGKEIRRIFVLKFRFWVNKEAKFYHIRQMRYHFLSLLESIVLDCNDYNIIGRNTWGTSDERIDHYYKIFWVCLLLLGQIERERNTYSLLLRIKNYTN